MDSNEHFTKEIEEKVIGDKDKRYSTEAYLFVIRSLDVLLEKIIAESNSKRHVTGQELSCAVRDCALREYGPTAKMVLEHWGIHATRDIGNIVYNLIEIGLMGKQESDRIEDFQNVYDFEDEFVKKFHFSKE